MRLQRLVSGMDYLTVMLWGLLPRWRNAGLCQHATRGGRNAAPDATAGGDSRQILCSIISPDFGKCALSGDGQNLRQQYYVTERGGY